jgi:hypothetical protein
VGDGDGAVPVSLSTANSSLSSSGLYPTAKDLKLKKIITPNWTVGKAI